MDTQDLVDVSECLDVCPLDPVACAHVCDRAAAVGARQRGLPFYVPFRQNPLADWTTLFSSTPAGSNWHAFDTPNAAFAPWIKATVPWDSEWNLSAPPLSATMIQSRNSECHVACDRQSKIKEESLAQGLGPLPGVYTGWNSVPSYSYSVMDVPDRVVPFGQFLESSMGPGGIAANMPSSQWELNSPLGAHSFRANHIPIHGQPVMYRQSLPIPLPARLS